LAIFAAAPIIFRILSGALTTILMADIGTDCAKK